MIPLKKLAVFFTFPIVVLAIHVLAMFAGFYRLFSWFDVPMHFFGGVAVALTFSLITSHYEKRNLFRAGSFGRFLFVVSLVALIAVLWEFFEFGLTFVTGRVFQGNLEDTLLDLFLGLLGGTLIALVGTYGCPTRRTKFLLTITSPLIGKFSAQRN